MADDSPCELADRVAPRFGMRLTDTQRAILVALCRPRAEGNRYATPATNQEIAAEVFLSVDAVKAHLRALYRKFGVEPLPHNQKRARLVELVMEGELISLAEEDSAWPRRAAGAAALPAPAVPEHPTTWPGSAPEPPRARARRRHARSPSSLRPCPHLRALSGDSSGSNAGKAATPAPTGLPSTITAASP